MRRGRRKEYYSWEGEDVLAWKISTDLLGLQHGRYVDIGAHHPVQMSNTNLFYQRGWRGLNIDARPGSMRPFKRHRPGDTNLEMGVAAEPGEHRLYRFENATLDGFLSDEELARHRARGCEPLDSVLVRCERIDEILEAHWKHERIDLLSIDVEGKDLEVLTDLNMERWRPAMIICEILGRNSVEDVLRSEMNTMLTNRDYLLFSRLHFSSIFLDRRPLRL